jgi:hypothetical protein
VFVCLLVLRVVILFFGIWVSGGRRLQNCIGGLFIYLVAGFVKTWAGVFHRVLFLLVHVWSVVMARY